MIRRFKDDASRASRGVQIWQILTGKAHNRQTMTYEQLATLLRFKGSKAGTLAHMLGHIYHFCQENNLPPLTVLVVNKKTGLPGGGFKIGDLHHAREKVFSFDWYELWPPTPEELDAAFKRGIATESAANEPAQT